MILYILALGSPTFPVPRPTGTPGPAATAGRPTTADLPGLPAAVRPPVLALLDRLPRHPGRLHARPRSIDYFENSRRATLAQRTYCSPEPRPAGPATATACGGSPPRTIPVGYQAHGAPPAQNDNGTITPTAAASSIVSFAPEVVIPTLRNMYNATARSSGAATASRTRSTSPSTGGTRTISASTRARS